MRECALTRTQATESRYRTKHLDQTGVSERVVSRLLAEVTATA